MRFCGWPEPAVKAVQKGCDFIPLMCDFAASPGAEYQVMASPCHLWKNFPMCCLAMVLPCFGTSLVIRTVQKVAGSGTCLEHWVAMLATQLFCVNCCYMASSRTDLRKKYGLAGSTGMDCLCTMCFPACVICQSASELEKRSDFYVPYAPVENGSHGSTVAPMPVEK